MFSKRSVETPRLIMMTTYTNITYHKYQGMFDIERKNEHVQNIQYCRYFEQECDITYTNFVLSFVSLAFID